MVQRRRRSQNDITQTVRASVLKYFKQKKIGYFQMHKKKIVTTGIKLVKKKFKIASAIKNEAIGTYWSPE